MSDLLKSFLAGWCGGIGNLVVGHPFDTVKTLLQNAPPGKYKGSADLLKTLVKNEGPLAVYTGVTAPMAGVGTVFALYFLAYDGTELAIRKLKNLDKSIPLTMPEVLICGGSTGLIGSLILGPAELIKIQQQTATSQGLDNGLGAVCKNIYKTKGVPGFLQGFGATCMRDIPGSMCWFGAYEFAKKSVCVDEKKPTATEALFAGGCGGLGMWSIAIPLDTVKTRVQANRGAKLSIPGAFSTIMRESGVKGFFRGLAPALLRAFPANAATFASKEYAQMALDQVL